MSAVGTTPREAPAGAVGGKRGLTERAARLFDRGVRLRGQRYFVSGRVRLAETSPTSVRAMVVGNEIYQVEVRGTANGLDFNCSCPFFGEGKGPCKHAWAVLLEAEARGHLSGVQLPDPALAGGANGEGDAAGAALPVGPSRAVRTPSDWKALLDDLHARVAREGGPATGGDVTIGYVVDVPASVAKRSLVIEVEARAGRAGGAGGTGARLPLAALDLARLPDEGDRRVLALLTAALGATDEYGRASLAATPNLGPRFVLSDAAAPALLPAMCETGRCRVRTSAGAEATRPLVFDAGPSWALWLEVRADGATAWVLRGSLRRGSDAMELATPLAFLRAGIVLVDATRAARLDHGGAFHWVEVLRAHGRLTVPRAEEEELLERLFRFAHVPRLDLPPPLQLARVTAPPRPLLRVRASAAGALGGPRLRGEVSFRYGERTVASGAPGAFVADTAKRVLHERDLKGERAAMDWLAELGFRAARDGWDGELRLEIAPSRFAPSVRPLVEAGWEVEAEGKLHRAATDFALEVRSSGLDWFELHGGASFGGVKASLPRLLEAVRRRETTVVLDDGSVGLLPEAWLGKVGALAAAGEADGDHLRFARTQVGVLDALVAASPGARTDADFERLRAEIGAFEGIAPIEAGPGFEGTLRPYQKEGLGWLRFLERVGFGGCLADDMGLGKTIQVLALLAARRAEAEEAARAAARSEAPVESRRTAKKAPKKTAAKAAPAKGKAGAKPAAGARKTAVKGRARKAPPTALRVAAAEAPPLPPRPPALVVAPRSVLHNWQAESARFTPGLRVLVHAGADRLPPGEHFNGYDLVLTTYGTMRRDAAALAAVELEYVILDEAQTIKNAASESAKAARALRARHRLALSGTPVENHLGELWSLFEFLNPGMLGRASVFQAVAAGARGMGDDAVRPQLRRALRPFVLRRTKEQVARDLPAKTEQTLLCEMEGPQRAMYDELRDHFRRSLLGRLGEEGGLEAAKMQVLEALLRLRQAACHPGLIDPRRSGEPSAKLDVLMEQLEEVLDEGHKALVFSQFTSMLAIVRGHLDAAGVTYEYLDGQTRDRQARVERFQTDPKCGLFLISLKAGGLGLNLTAADYVFLLDPWWNPAVEAQAVDRAHRIGQTRPVFAYRLLCKDSVEEKVAELQARKKELADALFGEGGALLRDLQREDLELLLS
ncbi:MAG TPA: DEAD/DEAH box helicase [Myxococcota bacterium]|nr:DEAD/DEAH box helicase [Myxococcota bacterium]